MSFKKVKMVMLPTNKKAKKGDLMLQSNTLIKASYDSDWANVEHLYFLSDEEIKEGDWMFHNLDKKPIQWNGEETETNPSVYGYKKIIATTELLTSNINLPVGSFNYLPQPSQSFIEKFVEEYNKGNVITEVMVEWEYNSYSTKTNGELTADFKLKINPKDNTITIRKVKESWNKEEVEDKIRKGAYVLLNGSIGDFDKWIEENL